jgi:hypothetical protein
MTIMCYRDGVLAADTAIWKESVLFGHITKVAKFNGFLCASASNASNCLRFQNFVQDATEDEDDPSFEGFDAEEDELFSGIIITPDGEFLSVDEKGAVLRGVTADFFAGGVAEEMAIGAMAHGATAEQAVRVCIDYHGFAEGNVDSVRLDSHPIRFTITPGITMTH